MPETITPDVRHQHLVVRAEIAQPAPTGWLGRWRRCRDSVRWLTDLIGILGMRRLYGPKARYCAQPGNRGLTAFAIIETSHLVLHTWDEIEPGILQLDVYTCSDLPVDKVLAAVAAFAPVKIEWMFLDRERGLNLIDEAREPRN